MQKIGFFGGSFNPVHAGHIILVNDLKKYLELDLVQIILNSNPPHKSQSAVSYEHRFNMLKLAFSDIEDTVINDKERDNNVVHYTYDTLKELREIYGKDSALFFMMGYDSLCTLDSWKNGFNLTDFAHLAVISRPQYSADNLPYSVRNYLKNRLVSNENYKEFNDALNSPLGKVFWIDEKEADISSTQLRTLIKESYQTPQFFYSKLEPFMNKKVIEYIKNHSLYSD